MNKVIKNDMNEIIEKCPFVDNLKNKTVLITGATGLIAKNFAYFLLELNKNSNTNIKVVALVRNLQKAKDNFKDYINDKNLIFLNQDICDSINYNANVDYILHAAGSASAEAIKSNPVGIIKANTLGSINVLEFAKEKAVKKVLFTSTREIYGKIENIHNIKESDMGVIDPLSPRSSYPESKRLAEALFESYYTQFGVIFNILRIAHTYGPAMEIKNDGRVMADFIGAVVNKKDIILNSDGTAIRSFCYVTDTIDGILHVMFKGENCLAYNLANETEPYMIKDVAQMLVDLFPEKKLQVRFANPDDKIKKGYLDYKIVSLDTSSVESLGWRPKIKLTDGMRRTVEYFSEENN